MIIRLMLHVIMDNLNSF